MIGFLRGLINELHPGRVMLDVGGVGYEIRIPLSVFDQLTGKSGREVLLHTVYRIKEQEAELFGFLDLQQKKLFLTLISLNGVGPAVALSLLSHYDPLRLVQIVNDEDSGALTKIGGIGQQKAKKIIFEMQSKKKKVEAILGGDAPGASPPEGMAGVKLDAVLALHENLGFDLKKSKQAVESVLESRPDDIAIEELIREALQIIQ